EWGCRLIRSTPMETVHDDHALAFSYLRFSSPEQRKGDSRRRQTELLNGWLAHHPRVRLDTSLTLRDLGNSRYTGEHRKNPDRHALALFLKLVEEGKIPHGSYLVIENLDRLSREDEVPACHLLTGILLAGIRVVQLAPTELLLDQKSDGMQLMRAVMELSRGHGESARKSQLNGATWQRKLVGVREGKDQPPRRKDGRLTTAITGQLPAWLEDRGGKIVKIPARAAVVKDIFRLAGSGYGIAAIVERLTAEQVPAFGDREAYQEGDEETGKTVTRYRAKNGGVYGSGVSAPC